MRSKLEIKAFLDALAIDWANGKTLAQIAAARGITANYAGSLIHKARAKGDQRFSYRVDQQVAASRKEFVAQAWHDGASKTEIARAAGLKVGSVNALLVDLRKAGDPRAKKRGRKDGRSHDRQHVYRSRAESRALKEAVLESWSSGEDGTDAAARLGIVRGYYDLILRRARKAGDPRAAYRYDRGWSRVIEMPVSRAA